MVDLFCFQNNSVIHKLIFILRLLQLVNSTVADACMQEGKFKIADTRIINNLIEWD